MFSYDTIMGLDLLTELGIDILCSSGTVRYTDGTVSDTINIRNIHPYYDSSVST